MRAVLVVLLGVTLVSRADGDLDDALASVTEQRIRFPDIVERERVGEEWRQIDAMGSDELHQSPHALLAAWTEGRYDALIAEAGSEGVVRQLQLSRVDAEARECAARTQAAQRALERLLRTERLDRDIRAAAGEALDFSNDVLLPIIDHDVRTHLPGDSEPGLVAIHSDDQRSAHELRADAGAEADRPLRKNHDGVADADASSLGSAEMPVEAMSASKTTCSSLSSAGIFARFACALGMRTYSACAP